MCLPFSTPLVPEIAYFIAPLVDRGLALSRIIEAAARRGYEHDETVEGYDTVMMERFDMRLSLGPDAGDY
jgi:hypothetical protein